MFRVSFAVVGGLTLAAGVWVARVSNADGEPVRSTSNARTIGTQAKDAGPEDAGPMAAQASDAGPARAGSGTASGNKALGLDPLPGLDGGTSSVVFGSQPDPPPLSSQGQWELELSFDDGLVELQGTHAVLLDKPVATARNMGRFALELYVGPQLLDRIRFDFPLLGAGDYAAKRPWNAPPTFERHLHASAKVRVPQSERATTLILLDRAAGQAWRVPWPPAGPSAATRKVRGTASP